MQPNNNMSTKSTSSASASLSMDHPAAAVNDEDFLTDGVCDVSQITNDRTHLLNDEDGDFDATHDNDNILHPSASTESMDDMYTASDDESSQYIVKRLKELYHTHVLDAEKKYHLHYNFCLPTDGPINDSEFDATPMVLLIGQYSTGKTTFLNHLLGEDFPGMHIGPEPTTDKFMALFHRGDNHSNKNFDNKRFNSGFRKRKPNDDESTVRSIVTDDIRASGRLVKGNTLTVTPNLPFSSLSQFGSAFLNHFVGSSSSSPMLKRIMFIDTPGVLSGEKQRINRTYDFGKVAKWFADRSDLILLLFDAHKLDISDEFKNVIDTISLYNHDKIRCVLNKADCVTREQLVRVYGSLMWSMGKIFHSPEVVRVYTGSYWNGSLINEDFSKMFTKDEKLLVRELVDLPRCSAERKVNQMVNRIRLVKVHVCILGTIRKMTPRLFGKKRSREQILNDLESIMDNVRVEFDLSKGDIPDVGEFGQCLINFPDFSVFPGIDKALISRLDSLIEKEIPEIVSDADIAASDVNIGQKKTVFEKQQDVTAQPPSAEEVIDREEASVPKKAKSESRFEVLGFLVKITALCILLFAAAEGAYYWRFSKPALSRIEFQDGYNSVVNAASESPYLSQVKSKVDSFHHHHEVKRPTKRTAPLSSLPTISGVAYTSDRAENADNDEL